MMSYVYGAHPIDWLLLSAVCIALAIMQAVTRRTR